MGVPFTSRWPYLLLLGLAVVAGVALSSQFSTTSFSHPSTISAQVADGPCQDGNNCLIWGVEPGTGTTNVYEINVCSRTTRAFGPFAPNSFVTAAASSTSQALILGDIAGGTAVYPLPAGPPGAIAPGTIIFGAKAFTEAFSPVGLPQLFAGVLNNTHTPVALLGAGTGAYSNPESDLVFDHAPNAKWPLKAAVIFNPTTFVLVDVSRADGSHHAPRLVANFLEGLAYDGSGNLWGLSAQNGIYAVNPATGVMTYHMFVPGAVLTDLASTPCQGGSGGQGDLGDAPDSTNHAGSGMTAYGGVSASFPSVFDPITGTPQGPVHWATGQDTWLGGGVSAEQDADKLPDTDGLTNLDPGSNIADRDGGDDGVIFPILLPNCQLTQFQFTLNIAGALTRRYANVWFDFNRNGQWGDQIQCVDPLTQQTVTLSEWGVQNQLTNLGPGVHIVTTPQFRSLDVDNSLWMRITVAEAQAPAADGRGAQAGYEIGETEDYLLNNTQGTTYSP